MRPTMVVAALLLLSERIHSTVPPKHVEDYLIELDMLKHKAALIEDGWEDPSFLIFATAEDLAASGLSAPDAVNISAHDLTANCLGNLVS